MKEKYKDIRKPWFRFLKKIMRIFIKETSFIYLDKKIDKPTIVLSNHVGTSAPLAWELYGQLPFRFWGASEMNSGLISLYRYQSRVFYHEKKHWNLHLARLFCLIASPLTYIFYKGLNLISTYRDVRFRTTISESIRTFEKGQNLIIFPEISDKGYLEELEGFHQGFLMLANICYKKGIDLSIYLSYYRKAEKIYVVDKPIKYSSLVAEELSREEMAKKLCSRVNELGKMDVSKATAPKVEADSKIS